MVDLDVFARTLAEVEKGFKSEFSEGFILETPEKLRNLHAYFAALLGLGRHPEIRCNAPRFSAVIGADGSLKPCYFLPGTGRLDSLPLMAALNLPEAISLRRQQRLGAREECARCVCPAFMSMSRVWRGL